VIHSIMSKYLEKERVVSLRLPEILYGNVQRLANAKKVNSNILMTEIIKLGIEQYKKQETSDGN
jgi:hypothetical protein